MTQQIIRERGHILVEKHTLRPIHFGETLKDFRGDEHTIKGGQPPAAEGKSGYIYTSAGNRFYPSVCDLRWELESDLEGIKAELDKPEPISSFVAPTLTITAYARSVSITKSGRNFLGCELNLPSTSPREDANLIASTFTKLLPDWCIIINDLTQDEPPGFAAVQELRR